MFTTAIRLKEDDAADKRQEVQKRADDPNFNKQHYERGTNDKWPRLAPINQIKSQINQIAYHISLINHSARLNNKQTIKIFELVNAASKIFG